MEYQEVVENLCVYDPRSPDYEDICAGMDKEDIPPPRISCYCDNCFSGRDKLAVELLKYITP